MTAQLHCFGESGNAYKAALTMTLAGFDWSPVFVDFFNGATRATAFRALNPMGEVPVLVDGSTTIAQSGVIQDYVATATGRLGATTPEGRREIWRWILFDNHKNSGIAGPLRFNMNFLPEERRNADVNAFLSMRHNSAMKVLDAALDGRDWLVGDAPTIADIANAGYLYYPEPYGFDRAAFPAVDAWLDRLAALPGWQHPYDLMPRSAPQAA